MNYTFSTTMYHTQKARFFIKQNRVWKQLFSSVLEGKSCWKHVMSNYNAQDALTVIVAEVGRERGEKEFLNDSSEVCKSRNKQR